MDRKQTPKKSPSFILKAEPEGIVEAIVNVYGIVDDVGDRILNDAFAKTLKENFEQQKIKVLNHHRGGDVLNVLGKCLDIREVARKDLPSSITKAYPDATGGLWTKTQFNLDTDNGRDAFALIAAGDVTEWSIGCYIRDYEVVKEDDQNVRVISECEIVEYSPVVWGANPATSTIDTKEKPAEPRRTAPPAIDPASKAAYEAFADLLAKPGDDLLSRQRNKIVVQKTLAQVLTPAQFKAIAMEDLAHSIRMQFYKEYDSETNWYVVEAVYENALVARDLNDYAPNRYWKVAYQMGTDGLVEFDREFVAVQREWTAYTGETSLTIAGEQNTDKPPPAGGAGKNGAKPAPDAELEKLRQAALVKGRQMQKLFEGA